MDYRGATAPKNRPQRYVTQGRGPKNVSKADLNDIFCPLLELETSEIFGEGNIRAPISIHTYI